MPDQTVLPLPALDHAVINTRERLAAAAACYRRLGFHLTPLGRHTLGSVNHLAVFAYDYLELVGIDPDAETRRGEILRFPEGLNGLVFATEVPDSVFASMTARQVPIGAPGEFSRPVTLATGSAEARFRVTRLEPAAAPYGRVYFCRHLTRHLVWRDEWRHHPNGAVGIARIVIAADEPDAVAALYRRMFGDAAIRPTPGGFSLAMGLARLDILSPDRVAGAFGAAAPDPAGRRAYPASLTLRTVSLDQARQALAAGGITAAIDRPNRLVVAAADAVATTLEFVA